MAQGNIYDALCTKWVQPFKSPEQLNSSSSHFSCDQRLRRNDRTGVARGATGPGQYLWCFMHQMGSTVQITRVTEQQQQSLFLPTAPSQGRQNQGCQEYHWPRAIFMTLYVPNGFNPSNHLSNWTAAAVTFLGNSKNFYGAYFYIQCLRAATANLSQARSNILP